MGRKTKASSLPEGCIHVSKYDDLENYASLFAAGRLSLLLIIGRPGTSKSQTVKSSLRKRPHLYIETHATALGMYRELFEHKDLPVAIDDLDSLYADRTSVRLLKSLCNTDAVKTVRWLSNASGIGYGRDETPPQFETRSSVCMIANKWETINENVRAIEDRAIIVHFDPSPLEVHQKVASWFDDQVVYDFIQDHLHMIAEPSMRHYKKGSQLRRAGRSDWQERLLEICGVDAKARAVVALMMDPDIGGENRRAAAFEERGFGNRDTYFSRKKRLGLPMDLPRVSLPNALPRVVSTEEPTTIVRLHESSEPAEEGVLIHE